MLACARGQNLETHRVYCGDKPVEILRLSALDIKGKKQGKYMPRRKRQFSFLERALKAAGGTATSGVLGEYAKFKAGTNKRNAGNIPASARKRVLYAIAPFGNVNAGLAAVPDSGRYKAAISQFSNAWRKGDGKISNTDIGYETVKAANQSDPSFYPAVAKIFVPTSATAAAVSKISGITKNSYKSVPGSSYSLPFGSINTKEDSNSYKEMAGILSTKASAAGARSVSFEPERWTSPEKEGVPGE